MTGKRKTNSPQHACNHNDCIAGAMAAAEKLCEQNSVQFTDLRRKVLELVWQSHQPVKAYDLLELMGKAGYSTKPPTVYRALEFLLEHRLIHKINRLNAYIGCTHPQKQHGCSLMICSDCGDVTECCNDNLKKAIDQVAETFSFELLKSDLEIEGVCKNCR